MLVIIGKRITVIGFKDLVYDLVIVGNIWFAKFEIVCVYIYIL